MMNAKETYSREEVIDLLRDLVQESINGMTTLYGETWIFSKIGTLDDVKIQKRKKYKTPEYRINKMKERGFSIIHLGKNIEARKGEEVYRGSVAKVHKDIFSY